MAFSPDVFLGETVKNFEKNELGFKIETTKRITYSKAIIIAAGVGAFEPRRLAAKNSSDFENKNVHYFVKDPQTFAKKDVAIAGGGDSAVDWALELEHVAKSVHIIHRRDQFRAMEGNVEKLRQSSVSIHTPYTVASLDELEDGKLGLTLKKAKSDEEEQLAVDDLIVNYGFVSDAKILASWGHRHQGGSHARARKNQPDCYRLWRSSKRRQQRFGSDLSGKKAADAQHSTD